MNYKKLISLIFVILFSGVVGLFHSNSLEAVENRKRWRESRDMLKILKFQQDLKKKAPGLFRKRKPVDKKSKSSKIRIRGLTGSTSDTEADSNSTSIQFIWNRWGIGQTSFKYKSNSRNNIYDLSNQSTNFSYTFGKNWSLTLGLSNVIQGKGNVTSNNKEFSTESASGSGYFWTFGLELWGIEFLGGYRKNSFVFKEFNKTNIDGTTMNLNADLPISGGQMMFGLGITF